MLRTMKTATIVLFLVGLALLTGLIAWQGAGTIAEVLAQAGWQLLWLPVFYLVPLAAGTQSWRLLFLAPRMPWFFAAAHANWIGLSVNWLLPVAQIGGEVVRARVIFKHGSQASDSIASVVVDKTIQALTQPLFALVGLGLLAFLEAGRDVFIGTLIFIALLGGGIYGFYWVQKAGIFGILSRFARQLGLNRMAMSGDAGRIDTEIRSIYGRRSRFLAACLWRMVFRFILAGEIWLALFLINHPVSFLDAVILECLTQIVVAVAFAVPGALGVQEGGFILLGAALGLSPDVALSLSLARRVRELTVGLPGLLAWQVAEGRYLSGRRGGDSPTAP